MTKTKIERDMELANPYPNRQPIDAFKEAKAELFNSITSEDSAPFASSASVSPLRRQRPRRVVRVVAPALALLLLSAAAWGAIGARTGMFGKEGSEEGAGELIRLDMPGADVVVDELGAGIPLPPNSSFDEWKSRNLRPADDGAGMLMTESGIKSTLSHVAACEWTEYWMTGFEQNDSSVMAEAQNVLDEIPTWEAIISSDPNGSVARALRNRARGARLKDPSIFIQEYEINCTPGRPVTES